MSFLRRSARGFAESVGTRSGLSALIRRRSPGAAAILGYHNVVHPGDAGRGDASLHLPLPRFLEQMDRLVRTHDVVALDDAMVEDTGRRRPRAVITFDDAYRGALQLALPELVRRGLPATVFVSPGLLGAASTWWDELGEVGRLDDTTRDECLSERQGIGESIREWAFRNAAVPELPASFGIGTRKELLRQVEESAGLISLGSHAWSHEHLPDLHSDALERTLRRALEWLIDITGRRNTWLALPYGAGTPIVSRAALELGHAGVLAITGGLWHPGPDRALVPRINVPAGLSSRGLELRTSGLLPLR